MENEYIKLFLLSMLPITELRLSVPIGLIEYKLNWISVFGISVAGNFIICIPILYLFKYFENLLKKNYHTNKVLDWVFKRTRSKSKMINLYKYYGIILFVGIPLPLTGAWTGCLASYLFGLSRTKTLGAVLVGLIISATLVTIVTNFLHYLLPYIGYDLT